MIVRWGLDAYHELLEELGMSAPLLMTTERWRTLDLPHGRAFYGVRPHVPRSTVDHALAEADGSDGIVAL